jgi:hypothetical protein
MLDIFRGLKSLIRVNHIHTDSPIFRLHYSITVLILIAFSLIVTTRQYVGNPIDCIHTKDIPEDVLNTFCWIHSTFTIRQQRHPRAEPFVSYPGVQTTIDEKDKKLVRYYQWVCFCLFFQVSSEDAALRRPKSHTGDVWIALIRPWPTLILEDTQTFAVIVRSLIIPDSQRFGLVNI